MRRIAIVGCSGGGKSTLARRLGETLGLPVIHIDTLDWRPGWRPGADEDLRPRIEAAAARDAWVIDGDFLNTAEPRFRRADAIVWVDLPRWRCLFRALRRVAQWRGRSRPDLPAGCPERLDLAFYAYIWNWDRDTRPRLEAALDAFGTRAKLIRLESDREMASFVASIRT